MVFWKTKKSVMSTGMGISSGTHPDIIESGLTPSSE